MHTMEIEMTVHAPTPTPSPFRMSRTASATMSTGAGVKRARSPSSPSPFDRPTKRGAFFDEDETSFSPLTPVFPSTSYPSPSDSAQLTHIVTQLPACTSWDDWVSQTRGLRIASPQISTSTSGAPSPVLEMQMVDEPMDDAEVNANANKPGGREASNPPRNPEQGHPAVGDAPAFRLQIPPSSSYSQRHQPRMHLGNLSATRYLGPPEHSGGTPSSPVPLQTHPPPSESYQQQQQQRLQIPAIHVFAATPSPVSMHHPSPSPTASASPSSAGGARRARFTMGPRADCEKCRQGLKGHWMHFE